MDCSTDFLWDGGRSINTDLMPDGRNPNGEGMRALADCLAVPFYTRSNLGEASNNALGVNLFFTSNIPSAPVPAPPSQMGAPTLAAVRPPVVVPPEEGEASAPLGLLTEEERDISCTAARCYKVPISPPECAHSPAHTLFPSVIISLGSI